LVLDVVSVLNVSSDRYLLTFVALGLMGKSAMLCLLLQSSVQRLFVRTVCDLDTGRLFCLVKSSYNVNDKGSLKVTTTTLEAASSMTVSALEISKLVIQVTSKLQA
jgi:hypothetical protein